ncbi:MAG: hypothetical protein GY851_20045 [bacterium]|nr:hypothetical protein [bacterium]
MRCTRQWAMVLVLGMVAMWACQGEAATELVQPADFEYLGAFRLPGGDERPETFAYGGNGMAFNPDGGGDGLPGSLFILGHERMPYGDLPNGNQFAEVLIPTPVKSRDLGALSKASFVQPFRDSAKGLFPDCQEIPRVGIEYLAVPGMGPRIHVTWGQHLYDDDQGHGPTHCWISPNLGAPAPRGFWHIGNQSPHSVTGYLFEIPAPWANAHVGGRVLATGQFRDGGWSGQGPCLYAYRPWTDDSGTPAPNGARLEEVTLLEYADSHNTDDVVSRSLRGYQHGDEWEGGAWLTTPSGKSAVMIAGTKGTGKKYWYGWINPDGPEFPCVETSMVGEFIVCRMADGSPCPPEDLRSHDDHSDYRGWWSSRMAAQFILYNPDDLARVAAGELKPCEPQPYASLDVDEHLFLNPSGIEEGMLGAGVQRRFRIGAVAFDRKNGIVYVLEHFADEAKPVVHVWRIR